MRLARAVPHRYPGHQRATLILARAAGALGEHADAIKAWRAIGPRDPAFRRRVQKRARSLVAFGRMAKAQQEAAQGASLHPKDVKMLRLLATLADAAAAPPSRASPKRRACASPATAEPRAPRLSSARAAAPRRCCARAHRPALRPGAGSRWRARSCCGRPAPRQGPPGSAAGRPAAAWRAPA